MTYDITDGNDGSQFTINSTTGEIRTATVLDHEMKERFILVVTAKDGKLNLCGFHMWQGTARHGGTQYNVFLAMVKVNIIMAPYKTSSYFLLFVSRYPVSTFI